MTISPTIFNEKACSGHLLTKCLVCGCHVILTFTSLFFLFPRLQMIYHLVCVCVCVSIGLLTLTPPFLLICLYPASAYGFLFFQSILTSGVSDTWLSMRICSLWWAPPSQLLFFLVSTDLFAAHVFLPIEFRLHGLVIKAMLSYLFSVRFPFPFPHSQYTIYHLFPFMYAFATFNTGINSLVSLLSRSIWLLYRL